MTNKDWTEEIDEFNRDELIEFAIHAMGLLATYPPYDNMTPQQIFEVIDGI